MPLPILLLALTAAPQPGDVIYQCDFDLVADRDAWSKADFATLEDGPEGKVMKITSTTTDSTMLHRGLDLTPYRDCQILLECRVKADNVSKPAQNWLGVKWMLHYKSGAGEFWGNQGNVSGTFDWKTIPYATRLAPDVAEGDLSLGLQGCTGTVWFDSLKITVVSGPPPVRPQPPVNPPPAYTGHTQPRLRGVMSPNHFNDQDLRVLGQEWHANLIRWQITRNWGRSGTDTDLDDYDKWFAGKLDELEQALAACQKYGLLAVIDVHWPPGGRLEGSEPRIFHDLKYQDHWLHWWEEIARRFKDHPAVWAYDLVNEPVQNTPPPQGVPDFLAAQVRVAKAIRQIDPDTTILIEANQWDSPPAFRELMPVDVPNVVYQVHMYVPGQYTHQGVHNSPTGIRYPGKIGSMDWDKDALRKVLAPVREFQLAYNVHIYVGEFSAARWAPGAAKYLSDVIDIFEEYGWDWTYHAYREWDGWSVEHGPDPEDHKPTAEPTDRQKLLLSWFAKDVQPK